MLFDTPVYILFLTVVTLVYWRLPHRQQNLLLLASSYLFYGWWDWRFLSLIATSTIVDYHCGNWIAASSSDQRRRVLAGLAVGLNLCFLGFFKYYDFFAASLSEVLSTLGVSVSVTTLNILLPPAISFYTFQEIAYIVDVYKGRLDRARSLVDYALFVSLFPHLIAGPIQRPSHLLPQVQGKRWFRSQEFFDGVMLFVTGLFRKAVIADNCALIADAAFSGQLGTPSLATVLLGIYAFSWQIYGDFSGYSDMARGSAQMLGFHFMVNFKQPNLASSFSDYWTRWHISLSTWLRDYLYIPLGGSRGGKWQTYRNLMVTMLLGGLWHGANWTFVIWGAIHGIALCIERFWRDLTGTRPSRQHNGSDLFSPVIWLQRIFVFHMIGVIRVFFRAGSASEALSFLSGVTNFAYSAAVGIAFQFLALVTIPLFLLDLLLEYRREEYLFANTHSPSWGIAAACAMTCAVVAFAANQTNAFIYFQF